MRSLIIQVTGINPPSNIPTPSTSTEWSIAAVALFWIIKEIWKSLDRKEKAESDLQDTLIGDLRANNKQLLEGNQKGFSDLVTAIQHSERVDLEASEKLGGAVLSLAETIKADVQTTLKTQTGIYTQVHTKLVKLEQSVEALHARIDELTDSRSGRQGRIKSEEV